MEMGGAAFFTEVAIEPLSSVIHSSLSSSRFSISHSPFFGIPRKTKKHSGITRSRISSNGGGVIIEKKEFEFKPLFDDYLKAMENVKIDRDSNNRSSNSLRKKKHFKGKEGEGNTKFADFEDFRVEKEEDRDKMIVKEKLERGVSYRKIASKKVTDNNIIQTGVKRKGEILDMERAAFKSLENEDNVIDKPRISRVDMEERIQKLARCLNAADINMPEWKFTKMMRSAQIRFSDHSVMRIIQILGKLGNWRCVLQVIEWVQSRERFKSHKIRYIYTAALDALGKARRPVEALNLFRQMLEHMASYPDVVAYHCIAVTLGQAGHMKELFDVIDTMRSPPRKKFKTIIFEKWDPRLEPDVIIYNAVLNACVRRKKWEGAFWVLQELNQQGQQPSSTTYGLVMELMFACGKYNLVHDFFKKVQKSCIPNALTYKVVVNTLWKEGKSDAAIMAVEDMERRGIVGTAGLYYDLARCLCSAGRCQEALKQIDKICKVANKPLVVTYTGLIQACLNSGDVQNGVYVFNYMQKFCSPNLITCNIMLKGFLDHGMFEEAKLLFLKLLENGSSVYEKSDYKDRILPDIYSFNTMLDACAAEKKWDDVEFVFAQMLQYGHHFNAKRHLRIILDARSAGKKELLESAWKHLVEAERIPPATLTREIFCSRLEDGDYNAALSCLLSSPWIEVNWTRILTENGHRFQEDALVALMHEVSILVARNENVVLEQLMRSCKEFLKPPRF
ncbi:pentatricopeptide repeat-containing protein At1g30610, chloroplastic isoform X2 [Olea europaea var. sylvestris]|uniref:pentatricopeptide repeat-containing protein At1g30610, chloroplastic isoform X2 n=1 Tax=Olea europaea var. sylvestris TaxID=158386 RepID=UPI000C1CFC04|nr:pentatricopeptide repeat-containing protein At1g30610, chloroplastic isoform X2 [Olea europaea var. sylvestris]